MKWKTLSPSFLDKLISGGKPIYVMNTSKLPSGNKGVIVVNFKDGNQREFFRMPPTFIPIPISDVIPTKRLQESKDFKQCLVKGMLTLVDPTQAEDYLSTREAQEEYEALMLSEHSMKVNNSDFAANAVQSRSRVSHQTNESQGPMQDISAVDTVSNKVRGLMESLKSGERTSKDIKVELRRHQSALSPVDLSYVIAESVDSEIKKWAQAALAESSKEVATTKKTPAVSAKKVPVAATSKKEKEAFDFGGDEPVHHTAASGQVLDGRSMAQEEINKMLRG